MKKKGSEEVSVVAVAKDELYEQYSDEIVREMLTNEIKKKSLKLCQYKRPTNIIIFKGSLPRTATKKVKRKEVKELISANC